MKAFIVADVPWAALLALATLLLVLAGAVVLSARQDDDGAHR